MDAKKNTFHKFYIHKIIGIIAYILLFLTRLFCLIVILLGFRVGFYRFLE